MPFPVVKLAYLVIKQAAKPIANTLKKSARSSPFLRNYILIKPAQWYHRVDTRFRLRLLNIGKTKEVKPLTEEMAVDLGADMLGEIFIFSVSAGLIGLEYWRQTKKEAKHESSQDTKLRDLEAKVLDMGLAVEEQSAQIRELNRIILNLPTSQELPTKIRDSKTGMVLSVQR